MSQITSDPRPCGQHRLLLLHPHLPHGLVSFPRPLLPWIELSRCA
jgi:hypothetical protein